MALYLTEDIAECTTGGFQFFRLYLSRCTHAHSTVCRREGTLDRPTDRPTGRPAIHECLMAGSRPKTGTRGQSQWHFMCAVSYSTLEFCLRYMNKSSKNLTIDANKMERRKNGVRSVCYIDSLSPFKDRLLLEARSCFSANLAAADFIRSLASVYSELDRKRFIGSLFESDC